jgi:hypothetical protein
LELYVPPLYLFDLIEIIIKFIKINSYNVINAYEKIN